MAKFHCHRCMMEFDRDSLMILHLRKFPQCKITNPNYDLNHEKQLMILFDQCDFDIESDLEKHILIYNGITAYQCDICKRTISNKQSGRRHLMQSCLSQKYTIRSPLLDIINHKKKLKLKKQPINELLIYNDEELYAEHILKITNNKYKCCMCNDFFTNKHDIYLHTKDVCITNMINNLNKLEPSLLESKFQSMKKNYPTDNELIKINADATFYNAFREMKQELKKEIEEQLNKTKNELNKSIEIIKNKPGIINTQNNNLQVLCLDSKKNCLDVLTEQCGGDFDRALEFIKGCALSEMSGDLRLIEKVYLDSNMPAMWYLDKKRNKIGWTDEDGKKNIDIGGKVVLRKLVSNLQNGYLKGVNYLITKNLDENRCPNKFLAEYDIQAWNNHIYSLCDDKYQNKLLGHLDLRIGT